MARNTPEILPYCQHCGNYKGVGVCRNSECDKTKLVDIRNLWKQTNKCTICSKDGDISCSRCGSSYCNTHANDMNENRLKSVEQHLGTCVICGMIICEQCWIFNNDGLVICIAHLESN